MGKVEIGPGLRGKLGKRHPDERTRKRKNERRIEGRRKSTEGRKKGRAKKGGGEMQNGRK